MIETFLAEGKLWQDFVAWFKPLSEFASTNFLTFRRISSSAVWPEKNRQMSIKVALKWFHYKNDRF